MSFVDVLPICGFLGASTTDTTLGLVTRHTVFPVERTIISQIFAQVILVLMGVHLAFRRHSGQTWALMVLATVRVRGVLVVALM